VLLDVTDRRRAGEQLRASEERYRLVNRATNDVIWDWDLVTGELLWNDALATAFGHRPDEVPADIDWWRTHVHPDDRARVVTGIHAAIDGGGGQWTAEYRFRRADGAYAHVLDRGHVQRDASGKPVRMIGSMLDLTERLAAEQALRRSEATLAAVLEALPVGVIIADAGGRIVRDNAANRVLWGVPPETTSWTGYGEWVGYWPDTGERIGAGEWAMARALLHGETVQGELVECERFGTRERRVFLNNAAPVRDADGRIVAGVVAQLDVTERLAAERALAEREAFSRAVIDSSPDCLKVLDREGRLTLMNAAGMCLMEVDDFALLRGAEWASLWPADSGGRVRRAVAVALAGGSDRFQAFCPTAKGTPKWWDVIVTPVGGSGSGGGGGVSQLIAVSRDITAIKQSEQQLRDGERRVRTLLDATAEGIYGIDPAGHCTFANSACARLLGYASPAELIGRNMHALVHHHRPTGDDYPLRECRIHQALREHNGVHVDDEVFWRKDGTSFPVEYWSYPVTSKDGQVEAAVVTFFDVTERRRDQAALRASEARFRLLADAMPQMLWVTRPDGHHEYFNRRWYEFTGVPAGSTDGAGWNGVFHPDDQPRAWARWQHSLATGEPYEIEYRLRHHGGEYRWTLGRALPIRDNEGQVVRWFGTCTDIHEQKLLQEALAAAREEAERANGAKDEFLAALSHELRTPLTPVLLATQLLEQDATLSEEGRDDVRMIRRNVEIETRLIDDLLDLTRVTRGKLVLDRTPTDVHDVLRHAAETSRDDAFREKRLRLVFDLAAAEHWAAADAARLGQVFWNLVKNAGKFTPADGTITLATRNPAPGRLAVTVADTGVGIDPGVLPHVFNAFEQGGADVTRRFGGLGLGLAICKSLTDLHGGAIAAHSEGTGRGATFTVELPTVEQPGPPEPRGHARGAARAAAAAAGEAPPVRPRLLLVEDHEHSGRVLSRLLSGMGYEVQWATGRAAALAAAAERPFDLIVSDLGLPDGSGHTLMRELRDRHGLRGIALSGYGMEDDVARGRSNGFVEHLVKPVSAEKLDAVIRHLLGT
jgi:PAS domain S-box-containing protein